MEYTKFDVWCLNATKLIRYGPDQKAVTRELLAHLEDHRDALIEQGIPPEEAEKQALDAMGSAQELAHQLAAVHRPFWGYFLRITRIAVAVLLCLCLFSVWKYFSNLEFGLKNYRDFAIFDEASYGGDTGRKLHHLSEPGIAFSSDGNTFTLTDAVVFTETAADGTESTRFYFLMEQFSLMPWTVQKNYFGYFPTYSNFSSLIYAVDSLGNTYDSFQTRNNEDPYIVPSGGQTGVFTYTHQCWINDFPAEAKWVEICYTRDGRDFRLKVFLKGGAPE